MANDRGRYLSISLPRRWMGDMLYFSRSAPIVMSERVLNLSPMVETRRTLTRPPSWAAIFFKAYGLMSAQLPVTRRIYLPFPWPRFYEAPYSVGNLIIHREFNGEPATFFIPIVGPEYHTLCQLDYLIKAMHHQPVERFGQMRRLIRTSRLPLPLRRLLWWGSLNLSGFFRVRNVGTFSSNSLAATRSRVLQTVSLTTLHGYYGIPDKTGKMAFQLAFDHRLLDGVTAAKCMQLIEQAINGPLRQEVLAMKSTSDETSTISSAKDTGQAKSD